MARTKTKKTTNKAKDAEPEAEPAAAEAKPEIEPTTAVKDLVQARKLEKVIRKLEHQIFLDNKALNELKKVRDAKVEELLTTVRGPSGPLLDHAKDNAEGKGDTPADAEDWRKVLMADLRKPGDPDMPALTEKTLKALADADVLTVGDLTDKQNSDRFNLARVKGLGPVAVQKIGDALIHFWDARQEQQQTEGQDAVPADVTD